MIFSVPRRFLVIVVLVSFMFAACNSVSEAKPRQRVVVHIGGPTHGPRPVTDGPGQRSVQTAEYWPVEKVSETALTPEQVKERKLKKGYGLLAFDVYPFETKIFVDGKYKGTPKKLNRQKNFLKIREGKHIIEFKLKNAPIKVLRLYVKSGYKTLIEQ